jgi:ElaB/YqjD/DUF883 family membrane-anchored ribosome-binding protein
MNTASNTTHVPSTVATPSTKVGEHLGEARDHLRQAGRGAIDTLSSAADQAREQYRGHRDDIRSEIAEAGHSLQAAASEARLAAREQYDHALEYGRELGDRSTAWVRANPLKALGIAVVSGIVLTKLLSRGR